jgi:hypothetical protein
MTKSRWASVSVSAEEASSTTAAEIPSGLLLLASIILLLPEEVTGVGRSPAAEETSKVRHPARGGTHAMVEEEVSSATTRNQPRIVR